MTDDTTDDREWNYSDEPQVPFEIPEDAVDYFNSHPNKERFPQIEYTTACFRAAKYYLVRAQHEEYYCRIHEGKGQDRPATERRRLSELFYSHAEYCEMLGRSIDPTKVSRIEESMDDPRNKDEIQ